ncbi:Cleavage/polyadenylation specificity factor, A subunit, C-terminal, partial [Lasallia pustulata]
MCEGKIVAGLVKAVVLYGLAPSTTRGRHTLELKKLASVRISTNPLSLAITPSTSSTNATIAIADLMKSVTIVEVSSSFAMKEVARHFASLWSSSVTATGDNEWLVADMDGNLAVLK